MEQSPKLEKKAALSDNEQLYHAVLALDEKRVKRLLDTTDADPNYQHAAGINQPLLFLVLQDLYQEPAKQEVKIKKPVARIDVEKKMIAREGQAAEQLAKLAAKQTSRVAICKHLLEHGVNANVLAADNGGVKNTPLHLAVGDIEMLEIAQLLVTKYGVDPNARDELGATALHDATNAWNYEAVQFLLENPTKTADVAIKDNDGHTALDYAKDPTLAPSNVKPKPPAYPLQAFAKLKRADTGILQLLAGKKEQKRKTKPAEPKPRFAKIHSLLTRHAEIQAAEKQKILAAQEEEETPTQPEFFYDGEPTSNTSDPPSPYHALTHSSSASFGQKRSAHDMQDADKPVAEPPHKKSRHNVPVKNDADPQDKAAPDAIDSCQPPK